MVENSKNLLRLKKRLESDVGKAIADYNMIEHGDTVLVCISGGKDSYAMLSILMAMQQRAPVDFRLIAMNLDQKQPGFPADVLPAYLAKGLEFDAVILANAGGEHYRDESERLLLYTACTRALHVLRVYCVGEPSPFLPNPSRS